MFVSDINLEIVILHSHILGSLRKDFKKIYEQKWKHDGHIYFHGIYSKLYNIIVHLTTISPQ